VELKSLEDLCERLMTIKQRVKDGLPKERVEAKKRKPEVGDGLNWIVVARGDTEIQTHTSFLTFGELMPLIDGAEPASTTGEADLWICRGDCSCYGSCCEPNHSIQVRLLLTNIFVPFRGVALDKGLHKLITSEVVGDDNIETA
jgi:hypothetical protein